VAAGTRHRLLGEFMNEYLELAFRSVVTIVFAASAVGKARAPQEFAAAVREMRVAPERLTGRIVLAVPLLEAALAAAVWVPAAAPWAYALAAGLTAVFTAVLVSVIRRRIDTACSCFGVSATPVGTAHVVRNCLLFAVAAAGCATALAGGPGSAYSAHFPEALLSIFAGACTSILIIATDVLADVFSSPSEATSRSSS
ncbi:MauE/DoxX family redox-associated membrane protein, partial [Kitasatospora indigofera]|uniref:MauE/DoxX family redox-associated membrane protein n=1 Tax=Kitasatospora indigofera TaxID=67307 RepID=UPI00368450A9